MRYVFKFSTKVIKKYHILSFMICYWVYNYLINVCDITMCLLNCTLTISKSMSLLHSFSNLITQYSNFNFIDHYNCIVWTRSFCIYHLRVIAIYVRFCTLKSFLRYRRLYIRSTSTLTPTQGWVSQRRCPWVQKMIERTLQTFFFKLHKL